jgi:hypothetical protein
MARFDSFYVATESSTRFFTLDNNAPAAKALDEALNAYLKLRNDFVGFSSQAGYPIVTITEGLDDKIVALGIKSAETQQPETGWQKTKEDGVYVAAANTPFYAAQKGLLQRLSQLPDLRFSRIVKVQQGNNKPANPDLLNDRSIAARLLRSWLFIIPPDREGKYYAPAGSKEIVDSSRWRKHADRLLQAKRLYEATYSQFGMRDDKHPMGVALYPFKPIATKHSYRGIISAPRHAPGSASGR